jgi:hypothetical protein
VLVVPTVVLAGMIVLFEVAAFSAVVAIRALSAIFRRVSGTTEKKLHELASPSAHAATPRWGVGAVFDPAHEPRS